MKKVKKICKNCKSYVYAVAIGQGTRCKTHQKQVSSTDACDDFKRKRVGFIEWLKRIFQT